MAIEGVSDTAYWIAAYRAWESARPDALFQDPLAQRLAGERGQRLASEMSGAEQFAWNVAIRTCIIDRWLFRVLLRERTWS